MSTSIVNSGRYFPKSAGARRHVMLRFSSQNMIIYIYASLLSGNSIDKRTILITYTKNLFIVCLLHNVPTIIDELVFGPSGTAPYWGVWWRLLALHTLWYKCEYMIAISTWFWRLVAHLCPDRLTLHQRGLGPSPHPNTPGRDVLLGICYFGGTSPVLSNGLLWCNIFLVRTADIRYHVSANK